MSIQPNPAPDRVPNEVWRAHQEWCWATGAEREVKHAHFIELSGKYKRHPDLSFMKDEKGRFVMNALEPKQLSIF